MLHQLFSPRSINTDLASLLLRLVFGLTMLSLHGYSKLERWDELKVDFAEPFGIPAYWAAALTIFAEFYCCIFIVLGLFTRISSIPIILCMAVAAFNIHAGDPWEDKEASLGYLAAFTAIFLLGSGKYALDTLIYKFRG